MILVLEIIVLVLSIWWIGGLFYLVSNGKMFKRFYHDVLEWHLPNEDNDFDFDGCSTHAKCMICGKDIMEDSQGNWF